MELQSTSEVEPLVFPIDAAMVHRALVPQLLLVCAGLCTGVSQLLAWNGRPWRPPLGVAMGIALLGLAHQGIWLWVEAEPVYAPVFAVVFVANATAMACRRPGLRLGVLALGMLLAPLSFGASCPIRDGTLYDYWENHRLWWEPRNGYKCKLDSRRGAADGRGFGRRSGPVGVSLRRRRPGQRRRARACLWRRGF